MTLRGSRLQESAGMVEIARELELEVDSEM